MLCTLQNTVRLDHFRQEVEAVGTDHFTLPKVRDEESLQRPRS